MFKRILSVLALLVLIPFFEAYTPKEIDIFTVFWLILSGAAKVWTVVRGTGRNLFSPLALLCWVLLLLGAVIAGPESGGHPSEPFVAAGYAIVLGWPLVDCLNILLPDREKK